MQDYLEIKSSNDEQLFADINDISAVKKWKDKGLDCLTFYTYSGNTMTIQYIQSGYHNNCEEQYRDIISNLSRKRMDDLKAAKEKIAELEEMIRFMPPSGGSGFQHAQSHFHELATRKN